MIFYVTQTLALTFTCDFLKWVCFKSETKLIRASLFKPYKSPFDFASSSFLLYKQGPRGGGDIRAPNRRPISHMLVSGEDC